MLLKSQDRLPSVDVNGIFERIQSTFEELFQELKSLVMSGHLSLLACSLPKLPLWR